MRGIFYSLSVLMILVPIVTFIFVYSNISQTQLNELSLEIRGAKMVSFMKAVDTDLERILEISSKRSIAAQLLYIDLTNQSIDVADDRLLETMLNSTLFGNPPLIPDSSLTQWIDKLESKGEQTGFDVNITVLSLSVKPYDSYSILVSSTMRINVSLDDMVVNRLYSRDVIVSLEDLEDPVYFLKTRGLLRRTIQRASNITNVQQLDDVTTEQRYVPSSSGPSYFDRLEGRLSLSSRYASLSSKPIGLESIVFIPDLVSVSLPVDTTRSVVDYLYFNSTFLQGYPVNQSTVNWLRLDTQTAARYNVTPIP